MNRRLQVWHYYAWGTIVLWAGAYVFTKVALAHFSPIALGFLRCAVASAALLVVLLIRREGFLSLKELPQFILSGALGFSLYLILFNTGAATLTATTSCIIISMAPVMTAFMAAGFFREKLGPAAWAAMGLEFAGILILTLWDGALSINQGVFWMLAAALAISAYNIIQRGYSRRYSPLQITAYSFFTGTVMLAFSLPQAASEMASASSGQLLVVAFLGLGPSALAYLWWAKALSLAGRTGAVANYMFLTPLLSLLLSYLIIAEVPDHGTLVGGSVILAGLLLFNAAGKR